MIKMYTVIPLGIKWDEIDQCDSFTCKDMAVAHSENLADIFGIEFMIVPSEINIYMPAEK